MRAIAASGTVLLLAGLIFVVNCTPRENLLNVDAVSPQQKLSSKDGSRKDGRFNWLDTWEPPGRIKEWFPFHKLGLDYDGAPVFLCAYGQWNFRKLFNQGNKVERSGMETYLKYINELFIRDSLASEAGSGVMIYDWDGFNLASYAHPEALHMTLYVLRELAESQKFLGYGFSINTNFAANSFLNIAKPFLGTYLDKLEVYGSKKSKWLPRVLAKIPADSLPTKYVGKN